MYKNDNEHPISTGLHTRTNKQLEEFNILENDVIKAIEELNPNKACGPDQIHPKLIIECKEILVTPLTQMFNKSLQTAEVPSAKKNSTVTPIFR